MVCHLVILVFLFNGFSSFVDVCPASHTNVLLCVVPLVNLHHLLNTITVLAEMTRIGVDFCIDVHGDEALPYNFLSGSDGVGKWGPRLKHLQDKFAKSFRQVCGMFVDNILRARYIALRLCSYC